MQRRAAAIYAALFIVIAAGSYAVIGVAQEPTISVANPDYSLSSGETLQISGEEYRISVSGGSAEIKWTHPATRTEVWKNGSTVSLGDSDFTVDTSPGADPPAVILTEVQKLPENVTTVELNGSTFVVVTRDGTRTLVPESTYRSQVQGDPNVRRFALDEEFEYRNQTVTMANVSDAAATVTWQVTEEPTRTVEEGDNVTLGGRSFVAHFPDPNTLELTSDFQAYQDESNDIDTYHERISGLWGVSILSGLAAVLVLGLAYLPSRY